MSPPFFSILIPTYSQSALLREAIQSVLRQSFSDYEIIVSDDCSTDDTREVVEAFGDGRIHFYRNSTNLGYGRNLEAGAVHANGEILYLLGHDDIVLSGALESTYQAFADPRIGAVTRPYYWFFEDPRKPIRAVKPLDEKRDTAVSLDSEKKAIQLLFRSLGQLSGLAYRRSYMGEGFHPDIFPAHVYPFVDILKRADAVYLKDYTIAVRTGYSMTRHLPQIYEKSPTETWLLMFESVYPGPRYKKVRDYFAEVMLAGNYEGLLQLKNYGSTSVLFREILLLLRRRPRNLAEPKFWMYSLLSLVTPAPMLSRIVDAYKKHILARTLDSEKITKGL